MDEEERGKVVRVLGALRSEVHVAVTQREISQLLPLGRHVRGPHALLGKRSFMPQFVNPPGRLKGRRGGEEKKTYGSLGPGGDDFLAHQFEGDVELLQVQRQFVLMVRIRRDRQRSLLVACARGGGGERALEGANARAATNNGPWASRNLAILR